MVLLFARIDRESLEGCCAGFGDRVILFAGASADADGAYDFAFFLQGDAACEDHDLAVVGGVDAEELVAGLGVCGEVFGGDVEGAGGPGLQNTKRSMLTSPMSC